MRLYAYHLARRATDILRWQDGLRQDDLHADEEREQPRHVCSSADVGLRAHLVKVGLCEAGSWSVDCRHVEEQLASIVRIKLGLRMHGVRDDAPLVCRLVPASGCAQPLVPLGLLSGSAAAGSRVTSTAGANDLCFGVCLPALLRDLVAAWSSSWC